MNDEPVGTVIETEEIYGHTFKKRKLKIVQWLKKVDVGTLLYVNPSKEDEGKVCARCGAMWELSAMTQEFESFDRTASHMAGEYVSHPVKEQGNPVAWRSQDRDGYWCIYQSPVEGAEPLYTGFKELTDEEIEEVIRKHWNKQYGSRNMLTLCKAVLKEANK